MHALQCMAAGAEAQQHTKVPTRTHLVAAGLPQLSFHQYMEARDGAQPGAVSRQAGRGQMSIQRAQLGQGRQLQLAQVGFHPAP